MYKKQKCAMQAGEHAQPRLSGAGVTSSPVRYAGLCGSMRAGDDAVDGVKAGRAAGERCEGVCLCRLLGARVLMRSRNDAVLLRTGDGLLTDATESIGALGHAGLLCELVGGRNARWTDGEDMLDLFARLGRVLLRHHVEVLGVQSEAGRRWRRHAENPQGAGSSAMRSRKSTYRPTT